MFVTASIVDDVLTYPDMKTASDDDKPWLATLVDGFSARAEMYTGRFFEKVERTMTFTCDTSQQVIQLPAFNELEGGGTVATVHESSDNVFDSTSLISSSDYYYDSWKGKLVRKYNAWTPGLYTVQVKWTDGFALCPPDIRMACILQVMFWYQSRAAIGKSEVRLSQGGQVKNLFTSWNLLDEVREVLDQYGMP